MAKRRTRVPAFGLLLLASALVGCGTEAGGGPSPAPQPTQPVTAGAVTVAEVETHLNTVLRWGWGGYGPVRCDGSEPVTAGTPITCTEQPESTDGEAPGHVETALVVVLDDAGRYAFTAVGPGLYAVPSDYPPSTTDCAVLAAPPVVASAQASARTGSQARAAVDTAGPGRSNGLHYTALLHHWLMLGSPTSMDVDGDGRPCEEFYPAEVIDRILASPLSPRSPVGTAATMEDVRLHAQSVLAGTLYSLRLDDCATDDPAATGASMLCSTHPDVLMQTFDILLVVLDDTGRYSMTGYAGGTMVEDYPAGSNRGDFAGTPPGEDDAHSGPGYADVLASWAGSWPHERRFSPRPGVPELTTRVCRLSGSSRDHDARGDAISCGLSTVLRTLARVGQGAACRHH